MKKYILSFLLLLSIGFQLSSQSLVNSINGEGSSLNTITISPNPTKGDVVVNLGSAQQQVAISINDITGRSIGKTQNYSGQFIPVTVTGPNGIYFITVTIGQSKKVIRLIKS